jgi:hypothetical protein
MSMTNEELIEELYYKAHKKGFFHELHEKVDQLKKVKHFKCNHELVRVAYNEVKSTKSN